MKIGFTGTQQGMTLKQEQMLLSIVGELIDDEVEAGAPFEFHHGDCVGADAEAHDLLKSTYGVYCAVVIHPPDDDSKRAFKEGTVLPTLPYLRRNGNIARTCDVLIAAPKDEFMKVRSGTWATVRYARDAGKPGYIIIPSGEVRDYETI